MNDEKNQSEANTKRVSLRNLYLDPNNYRIIHEKEHTPVPDEQIKNSTVARRTLRLLAGERNQHIQDLIESFRANGYLPVDQIQVRELADGGNVVVEGNRRIAALKYLANEYDQKGIDLGQLDPGIFSKVPVVTYAAADDVHHLTLMALKHISGNKKWGEWNQAKLLEKFHSTWKLEEDDICQRIDISKVELRRSLRALSLVKLYQKSDYGDQFDENKFPIFREAVRNTALKSWLSWDEASYIPFSRQNLEQFFSWLSREPIEEEDSEGYVGEKFLEPAITKRDDIRLLGKILADSKALSLFISTRNLNAAYLNSNLLFSERQETVLNSINSDILTLSQLTIQSENLPELEKSLGRLQSIIDRTKSSGLSGVEQKTVFHDCIGKHFNSLTVSSYKLLQEFKLHKLSRINLFAGINNKGKTTLLESIYLLARQNDFAGLLEVVRRRGKIPVERLDPGWFLDQLYEKIKISGQFGGINSEVSIRHYQESDSSIDMSRYLGSVEMMTQFGDHKQESLTRIFKGRDRETQADSIKLLCPVVFSNPFFSNESHSFASFYHKSVQSKALPEIFAFIREKILPTLNDIRLTDERQRFVVNDSRFPKGVDLSSYGEGLQRVFFISLLVASAQNGVVLIDEFENAIHTNLIGQLVPFIHELVTDFNVQLFLTSHSKECMDAFVTYAPDKADDFTYHALVTENEKIVSREFGGQEFKKLLQAGNVDIRRAK
ncbi:MAG: AAA family ATPase [Magnetococcus sp. DMHC-6]